MANNLEVKIKIGADGKEALDAFVKLSDKLRTTQVDFRAAQDTVTKLAREVAASDSPSKELTKRFDDAKVAVKKLAAQVDDYRAKLSTQRGALTQAVVDVSNLTEAYKKLKQQSEIGGAFKALDFKPFAQVQSQINSLNAAYKTLADSGKLSLGELAKAKLQLKDKTAELHSEMNNFGGALQNLNSKWLVFAGAVAGAGAAFKGLIDAGVKMESIKSQLDAVTGSGTKTADALKYIKEESNRLGQRTDVMAEGFAKLAASAKGTALEGAPLKELFSGVAEASTVMHLSADKTNGVLNALSQMMGKGVVSAEEFRQQLGDHLPQATQVGAKALGVTTAEFTKMLNSGQILAADFLPKFGKALRESVAGGLPAATQGATAAFNRLYNAVLAFKQGLVDGGIMTVVAALANALAKLIEIINGFTPATKSFIAAILAIGGGFAAWKLAIAPVVSAISSALIPAMTGATVASGVLSVAMRAIPAVALALAIYEGVRALSSWFSGAKDAEQATAQLNQQTSNTKAAIDQAVGSYDAAYAKMAENIKAVTELQKGQYQQQLADLDAKLTLETAAITANAGLSEQQKEQAKNEAFIAASAQRLTIIQTFQALQLQQLDVYHEQERAAKQAQLDALNGEELQKRTALQTQLDALDLAHLEARRAVYAQAQSDLGTHIGNLITERQRELDAAKSITDQIVANEDAQQQAILTIQRAAMNEKELMQSKEMEESAKIAKFKEELAKGDGANQKLLNELAQDAVKLITSNATEKAKGAKAGYLADLATKDGVDKVKDVYKDLNTALVKAKENHNDNATAIGGEMESATTAMGAIQAAISQIDEKLVDAKKLRIEIDQDSLEVARGIIDGLTAPATKTITIETVNAGSAVPAQATGGLAGQPTGQPWRFSTGGWARMAGLLSGYGGGDRRKALLEDGEFVVRKEAVQKLGVPFLQAVNQGDVPIQRAGGGSVGLDIEKAFQQEGLKKIIELLKKRKFDSALENNTNSWSAKRSLSEQVAGIADEYNLDQSVLGQVKAAIENLPQTFKLYTADFLNAPLLKESKKQGLTFDTLVNAIGKGGSNMPSFKLPALNLPTIPSVPAQTAAPAKVINVQFKAPDGGKPISANFGSESDVNKFLDVLKTSGMSVGAV